MKILDKKVTKLNYTHLLIDPNQRIGIWRVAPLKTMILEYQTALILYFVKIINQRSYYLGVATNHSPKTLRPSEQIRALSLSFNIVICGISDHCLGWDFMISIL